MTVDEAVLLERFRCLKIVEKNMSRLPNYNPNDENELEDKVEQGYGNACLNIKRAIEDGRVNGRS